MSKDLHRRFSPRTVIDGVTTFVLISASIVVMWRVLSPGNPPRPQPVIPAPSIPTPPEPLSLEGAELLGSPHAKVAIIEFSDFECPFCATFSQKTLPALMADYIDANKVRLAFRHLPMAAIHPRARPAAEWASCAGAQGKFWPLHDSLFRDPKKLSDDDLKGYAESVGLDGERLAVCVRDDAPARVRADAQLARSLGILGTPTFFIGRVQPDGRVSVHEVVAGARPLEDFVRILDLLLRS